MCQRAKRQWTLKEWTDMLKNNGYKFKRFAKSSHQTWTNGKSNITFPININCMLARRLIRENNLTENQQEFSHPL